MIEPNIHLETTIRRRQLLALAGLSAASVAIARWPSATVAMESTPVATGAAGRLIPIEGVNLYVVEHGDPSGSPLLLLHGAMGNTENWEFVFPYLVDAGYRVILLDSRNQGRSGWGTEPVTFERMARDVIALLEELEIEQIDVVGWSDGAIVGLVLAMSDPSPLKHLVAYGANYSPDGIQLPTSGPALEALVAQFASDYQRLSPQPERFQELFAQLGALYEVAPNFSAEQLGGIATPILILDGENEEFVLPEQPVELAELIPDAQLVLLPGTGHFAPFEKPEEFATVVIAFLANEPVGTSIE